VDDLLSVDSWRATSTRHLIAHLADQFDTTAEQVAGDVRAFLAQLLTLGLISRTADQPA
jgi:hypothetical protein